MVFFKALNSLLCSTDGWGAMRFQTKFDIGTSDYDPLISFDANYMPNESRLGRQGISKCCRHSIITIRYRLHTYTSYFVPIMVNWR